VNCNGRYVYMVQWNSAGAVPFFQSPDGWAVLWNNTSMTKLNPSPTELPLRPTQNTEATMTFVPEETGLYHFFLSRPTDQKFRKLQFTIGDRELLNKRPAWEPKVVAVTAELEKGTPYPIRATGEFRVLYHPPSARNQMVLKSEMGELIDYHFVVGNTADERVAAYRLLTGSAPMFPAWAYGFFQSKERYETGAELLETVKTFREKKLPLDCIVQDWRYWGKHGWNALRFDEDVFPDIRETVQTIHENNARVMISVWPNFGDSKEGSQDRLEFFGKNGWLLERTEETAEGGLPERARHFHSGYVDVMHPGAREAYWNLINTNIFGNGIDALWLDATEPNLDGYQGGLRFYMTHQGPGAYWLNLYPFMHSKNIYERRRATE
ncbi:MAG TPA: TIM-barrel domain-containing protein, partial [Tichowtungia sp.]|nr:TIM-barrel domain-containing protein [Tichowtungia sp.]